MTNFIQTCAYLKNSLELWTNEPVSKSLSLIFLTIFPVSWGDALEIQLQRVEGLLSIHPPHFLSASVVSLGKSIFVKKKTKTLGSGGGMEWEYLWKSLFSLYSCP